MSTGTGGKPITAEVLVVKSFDDLAAHAAQAKGKIIVYNVPFTSYGDTVAYRSAGAVQAAKYGGVAALVRSVGPYGIQTVHTGASTPVNGVPSGCISAEDASQLQRFQDRLQKTVIELSMEAHVEPDVPSRNIIIDLPGTDKADEFVLIGGHIDSWDVAEGAMDDGSSVFSPCCTAIRLTSFIVNNRWRRVRVMGSCSHYPTIRP
jgi:carboxypeptidase Q